jgi:hypothetical protein
MSTLNFKKTAQEWIAFYVEAIRNRLRRDLNLSDVLDIQAARDNLGLNGDNNHTHYHDDRYIPLIDKVQGNLDNEISDRKTADNILENKMNTAAQQLSQDINNILTGATTTGKTYGTLTVTLGNGTSTAFDGSANKQSIINSTSVGVFNSSNQLVFPNGSKLWF